MSNVMRAIGHRRWSDALRASLAELKTCRQVLAASSLLGLSLILGACVSSKVPDTTPLVKAGDTLPPYGEGYQFYPMVKDPRGEVLTVLAFSGGGKRSAAFAHGALRGLRGMMVMENGVQRPLLDEVDYISSVSGGSFPAAHYGLYHEKSFETFPEEFLYRDIESYIYGTFLLPWNYRWAYDADYGTNDRMADVYNDLMFHGATYADMLRNGLPLVSVNATDIANGASFPFTQRQFDLLCANLLTYPIARAVAASNGFPILFTPITLKSHRKACGASEPPLSGQIPDAAADELSRRSQVDQLASIYLNGEETQYVHLMDGGIADNLALRALFNQLLLIEEHSEELRRIARRARRVLVISVDGQSPTDPNLGKKRVIGGLGQIFAAVSGTQIDSYNFETLLFVSAEVNRLVDRIRSDRCAEAAFIDGYPCDDVKGRLAHVSLRDVTDPAQRARLQAIPTGLTIPRPDVAALLYWGERLVREDPDIRAMTQDLDSPPAPAANPRTEFWSATDVPAAPSDAISAQ